MYIYCGPGFPPQIFVPFRLDILILPFTCLLFLFAVTIAANTAEGKLQPRYHKVVHPRDLLRQGR